MFVVSVQPFQIKLHNFSSSYCTYLLLHLVRTEQTQQAIMELVLLIRIITRTVYTQRQQGTSKRFLFLLTIYIYVAFEQVVEPEDSQTVVTLKSDLLVR